MSYDDDAWIVTLGVYRNNFDKYRHQKL